MRHALLIEASAIGPELAQAIDERGHRQPMRLLDLRNQCLASGTGFCVQMLILTLEALIGECAGTQQPITQTLKLKCRNITS